VIELQVGGACYSWRLPPPRRLGGVISVEARKKLVQCSGEELCEENCAHPAGAAKSNFRKTRVIELPSLVGRFLRCPTCGLDG
jgi:hypothetical protein